MELEQHYSPSQLAEILNVSLCTIHRLIARGRIPRVRRISRRMVRVPASAVEAFLKSKEMRHG